MFTSLSQLRDGFFAENPHVIRNGQYDLNTLCAFDLFVEEALEKGLVSSGIAYKASLV